MTPLSILAAGFDQTIAKAIIDSYVEIERNYVLRKWKPSELDAGHFVEAVRRGLNLKLTRTYTPFGSSLANFNDQELKRLEQLPGDESYRLLIPRALKAVYTIRNKRGVAHISNVNPNEMDATYILFSVKWILAELLRLNSGMPLDQTQAMVDAVVVRHNALVWKEGGVTWILDPAMRARDQVLLLLYDQSPRKASELREIIEYSNPSTFQRILDRLHKDRLVYVHADGICILSPKGVLAAETLSAKH